MLIQRCYYLSLCFFTIVTSLKDFLFCKDWTDKQVGGETRSRVKGGWKKVFFLHFASFILPWKNITVSLILSYYQYFTILLIFNMVKTFLKVLSLLGISGFPFFFVLLGLMFEISLLQQKRKITFTPITINSTLLITCL